MGTPEERTWFELQENLRKVRNQYSRLQTGNKPYRARPVDHTNYRNRKHTHPPQLPKLAGKSNHELPQSPPQHLRGSHYPVIPPLSAESDQSSLNRYGVDIFDQNYRNSPLPSYSPLPINNGVYQNSQSYPHRRTNHHRQWHDSLRDGGASRYSDLLYDVQYGAQVGQRSDELRRTKERKKNRYQVVPDRLLSANNSEYGRPEYGRPEYSRPEYGRPEFDIWKNKRWNEPENKEIERKFAWRDPRDEHKELVPLDDQRKILVMLTGLDDSGFARDFTNYFIKDFLEHDMVLDVVCQVLVEEREKAKMSTREFHQQEVRRKQEQKAMVQNQSIWMDLVYRPDIYEDFVNNILQETVEEESHRIVTESVRNMVDEYFFQKALVEEGDDICKEVIHDLLPDVAIETSRDALIESLAYSIIDSEIRDCTKSFLEEAFATGTLRLPLNKQEQHDQKGEVEKLAYHMLIDSLCLDHLLGTIASNGQTWNEEEYLDNFLDDHLADILLTKYLSIVNRRMYTACCIPLKRLHEKMATQVALDVILDDLTGHLEEDMHNLFEYERALDQAAQQAVY